MKIGTPAFGRDYTSQKAVKADWEAGKDFILNDMFSRWDGKPFSRRDCQPGEQVQLRYARNTKVMMVTA